jgi:hypothetical protein
LLYAEHSPFQVVTVAQKLTQRTQLAIEMCLFCTYLLNFFLHMSTARRSGAPLSLYMERAGTLDRG